MQSELRSWLSVSRDLGRGSAQINVEYTEYLDALPDTIENELLSEIIAPDLRYSLPSAPVFRTPADPANQKFWHGLYWNLNTHYLSENTEWEDSSLYNSGARMNAGLSASNRIGGIFALSPSVSLTGTAYDRDKAGNRLPGWLHGSTGLALSTDLYGIFQANFLGYSLIRHTITPAISASWAPDRFITTGGTGMVEEADSLYYSFSDISLPSAGTSVNLSLVNTLEGKRVYRGNIERVTLAELSLGTNWSPDREERAFSSITGSLNLTPANWFSTRLDGSYDPYGKKTESVSLTTGVQLAGNDPTLRPIPVLWCRRWHGGSV